MSDTTSKRFAHVKFGVRTDVGRKRHNNEDAHGEWPAQGVFCVADGMGGAQDGEVASRAVVESLAGLLPRWAAFDPPMAQEDRLDALARALDAASFWVKSYADSQGKKGCGSTFVGICLDPGDPSKATAMHAGDSRVYRVRGRKIVQITRDHSVAQMAGVKDEKELNPMFRSLILRAVGIKPAVETERTPFDVAEGDRLLVCSDGLSRMVPDKEIAKIASEAATPDAAADALVDRANELGGKDNVTVVAVFVGALPAPAGVRARLTEAEMAALFAAPGGGDRDSTTGVTDGETRSDDTGLTIPKGAGAFDTTTSSGEFLPPGGLQPPKEPLDDDDVDDEPPPDTDEIPVSAKVRRALRGAAFAVSHAVRTPAGASALGAALVAVLLAVVVPPMRRAAAEKAEAAEQARIEAEKEAEAKRIAAEKEKAEAARREKRKQEIAALFATNQLLLAKSDKVLHRIGTADTLEGIPSEDEIERLYHDGRNDLSGTGSFTRDFGDYAKIEDEWTNRFVRLVEARADRIEKLEKAAEEAAQAVVEAKAAQEQAAKVRLADAEKKWSTDAEDLSSRIEKAASSADASVLGQEVQKLFLGGVAAFGALDETARGLPEFSSAVAAWSNRCDSLSQSCSQRADALAKEEAAKAAAMELERKTNLLASIFDKWCENASALSNRICGAATLADLPAENDVTDLRSHGLAALGKSGFVRNNPPLAEKEAAWSSRCDRLATQWTERRESLEKLEKEAARIAAAEKARTDAEVKEEERILAWSKAISDSQSTADSDEFRNGAAKFADILRSLEDVGTADRIDNALRGKALGGAVCAALEDAFVGSVALRRFAIAPGVGAAVRRIGCQPPEVGPRAWDVEFVLVGLAVFATPDTPPDTNRWKDLRATVINFNDESVLVNEEFRKTLKSGAWTNELPTLAAELRKDVESLVGKPKAEQCLSDCLSAWGRSATDKDSALAKLAKNRLEQWRAAKNGDSSESLEQLALAIAGFETLLEEELEVEKGWEEVLTYAAPSPSPSTPTFRKLLSTLKNRLEAKYPKTEIAR